LLKEAAFDGASESRENYLNKNSNLSNILTDFGPRAKSAKSRRSGLAAFRSFARRFRKPPLAAKGARPKRLDSRGESGGKCSQALFRRSGRKPLKS
jgi:hypothetical protein